MIVVTPQEFAEWKQHRVTQAFMTACNNDREILKEMLLAGTEDDANVRGRAAALGLILAMQYEDLMESVKENRE
jgi:hypothetical protein